MTAAAKTNVCLVGVGLIGGSLGMALRRHKGRYTVIGLGRNRKKLAAALRMGAVDRAETDTKTAVGAADIIVLCVPVHLIASQLAKMTKWIKKGAIVTDVGSVKQRVVKEARRVISSRKDISFVGGHPIAGSEKTGVQNANAALFKSATCVITSDGAPSAARRIIASMWKDAGAQCIELRAADHDRWLALTSHLPHLLAFSLFESVSDAAQKNPVIKSLVAGSFRDMTRIAGADPDLWAGILETNRTEISKAIRDTSARLSQFGAAPLSKLIPMLRRLQHTKKRWPNLR